MMRAFETTSSILDTSRGLYCSDDRAKRELCPLNDHGLDTAFSVCRRMLCIVRLAVFFALQTFRSSRLDVFGSIARAWRCTSRKWSNLLSDGVCRSERTSLSLFGFVAGFRTTCVDERSIVGSPFYRRFVFFRKRIDLGRRVFYGIARTSLSIFDTSSDRPTLGSFCIWCSSASIEVYNGVR